MSSSPQPTSTKRPLEEVSSPSRTGDQPEAKRPALDKVLRNEGEIKESNGLPAIPPATVSSFESNGTSKTNGDKKKSKDDNDSGSKSDTAEAEATSSATSNTAAPAQGASANAHDETAWIHIRAVISSPEAATIIGKGGENVSKIRQMSNAKCTVSDYQKGAVERILTVSGVVDAVAKVRIICVVFVSRPSSCHFISLTLPGVRSHYSYAEQRATGRALKRALQDLPAAPAHPSHPDRLHHWQGRIPYQGDPGSLRCPPERLGLVPASLF